MNLCLNFQEAHHRFYVMIKIMFSLNLHNLDTAFLLIIEHFACGLCCILFFYCCILYVRDVYTVRS
jgi:hypothetical protein